jgi:hypothetical protein
LSRRESVLAALAGSRQRLLAAIEGLEEPRFSERPAPRAWSAAHVIEHLARAEERLARGVQAVATGTLVLRPRWDDPLRRLLYVTGAYRFPRIRAIAALSPAEAPRRPEALARITATRAAVVEAIERGDGPAMWAGTLRHPVMGPLAMEEMLRFVAYHEERHARQIGRIRASLERARV